MVEVKLIDLDLIDYKEAWDYQTELFDETVSLKIKARKEGKEPAKTSNYIITCQHPHVYTLGKSGDEKHLLINKEELIQKEATYYKINRGGDITYHGPGQLVVYPILDLECFFTDIHKYLRLLEEAVILTLKDYNITSGRSEGETGVWLDVGKPSARKICAMGVKSSRWVTMHGIGFNINTNLSYFSNIIPCGIQEKDVTSMKKELGFDLDIDEVKSKLIKHIADLFEMKLI